MKKYLLICLCLLCAAPLAFAAETTPQANRQNANTPNRATPNQATPNQATPNRATPNQVTPNRATPNRAAQNVETKITSDSLTYLADKQTIIFDKKVYVNRPDFELWADKLTVYLKPAPSNKTAESNRNLPQGMAAGDVDRLVATGNVRIKREDKNGTCAQATYTVDTGVMLMEGNPRLSDKENTITGETIRYFTEENRSEVLGSSKRRVEAVFASPKGARN